jgi:FtsP/CotA-like multicopper oxidase with cupredoxin domain
MISRRDVLKYGMATAALSGVSPRRAGADDDGVGKSPFKTQPFLEPLPVAQIKIPVNATPTTDGSCVNFLSPGTLASPGTHQFIERADFKPRYAYEIHVKENKYHNFHPAIGPITRVWGYDGVFPGPLFHAKYGEPIMVRFYNELPPKHVGFGIPSITTNQHNGHNASESDGYPGNYFDSGTCWDNHYPNVLNGFTADPETNDAREAMGTLWYHDHRQDFTAQNVYAGLAGGYLLFDDLDRGNEEIDDGVNLRLPSGKYDVTLAFGDKVFDAEGQLVYDFFNLDGILGDKMTVNGKIQPYFDVERRKYRFRMLDGGPSRFYAFALSDGTPLIQISNDGNLLAAPVPRPYVTCGVAERHDVIIDFSKYSDGTKVYLLNRAEQTDGRGPTGKLLTPGDQLMEFRVHGYFPAVDPSLVKDALREQPPIDLTKVVRRRRFEFDRSGGSWTVNNRAFNEETPDAQVKRNTREVWTLKNGGGGWSHPIHIHLEEFRILSFNGRTPRNFEARKDVMVLGPNDEAEIFFNFRDYLGKYVMHCHNVVHEDHAMMIRFDLVE